MTPRYFSSHLSTDQAILKEQGISIAFEFHYNYLMILSYGYCGVPKKFSVNIQPCAILILNYTIQSTLANHQ